MKKSITTIKANSRGYAFLGRIAGAPDFRNLKKAEIIGEAGSGCLEVKIDSGEEVTAMLKRGYICVGPNMVVDVESSEKGLFITPNTDENPTITNAKKGRTKSETTEKSEKPAKKAKSPAKASKPVKSIKAKVVESDDFEPTAEDIKEIEAEMVA